MRKVFSLVISLTLMFSLIGCSSSEVKSKNEEGVNSIMGNTISETANNENNAVNIENNESNNNDLNWNELKSRISHFQNSRWGDSKEEVINDNRDLDLLAFSDDGLGVSTTVSGMDALIIFNFENDQLTNGFISFKEEHSNDNLYISDFERIKEALIEKYGNPINDIEVWENDLYKGRPTDYGFAVSLGHLCYITRWQINGTEIMLDLSGDNYEITHNIFYTPIGYESKIDTSRL